MALGFSRRSVLASVATAPFILSTSSSTRAQVSAFEFQMFFARDPLPAGYTAGCKQLEDYVKRLDLRIAEVEAMQANDIYFTHHRELLRDMLKRQDAAIEAWDASLADVREAQTSMNLTIEILGTTSAVLLLASTAEPSPATPILATAGLLTGTVAVGLSYYQLLVGAVGSMQDTVKAFFLSIDTVELVEEGATKYPLKGGLGSIFTESMSNDQKKWHERTWKGARLMAKANQMWEVYEKIRDNIGPENAWDSADAAAKSILAEQKAWRATWKRISEEDPQFARSHRAALHQTRDSLIAFIEAHRSAGCVAINQATGPEIRSP